MKELFKFLDTMALPVSFAVFAWLAFETPVMVAIIPLGIIAAQCNSQKKKVAKLEEKIEVLQRQVGIEP